MKRRMPQKTGVKPANETETYYQIVIMAGRRTRQSSYMEEGEREEQPAQRKGQKGARRPRHQHRLGNPAAKQPPTATDDEEKVGIPNGDRCG